MPENRDNGTESMATADLNNSQQRHNDVEKDNVVVQEYIAPEAPASWAVTADGGYQRDSTDTGTKGEAGPDDVGSRRKSGDAILAVREDTKTGNGDARGDAYDLEVPRNLLESDNGSIVSAKQAACTKPWGGPTLRSFMHTVLISGLGFFADAYDLFVIDFVVAILGHLSTVPPTVGDKSMVVSATLAGAVVGQLGFGFLADYLGRRLMFIGTAGFLLLGAFSSCITGLQHHGAYNDDQFFTIWQQLALTRFILGLGIGGEYPLSATVSSESQEDQEAELEGDTSWFGRKFGFLVKRPNVVAAVFSMQGVGMLVSSLLTTALLASPLKLDVVWRICLCFGTIPSSISFAFRWRMSETNQFKQAQAKLAQGREVSAFAVSSCSSSSVDEAEGYDPLGIYTVAETRKGSAVTAPPDGIELAGVNNNNGDVNSNSNNGDVNSNNGDVNNNNNNDYNNRKESEPPMYADKVMMEDDYISRDSSLDFKAHCKNVNFMAPEMEEEGEVVTCNIAALTSFAAYVARTGKALYAYRRAMLGTALSWFLIDVTLYGNGSFKTAVINSWLPKRRMLSASHDGLSSNNLLSMYGQPFVDKAVGLVGLTAAAAQTDQSRGHLLKEVEMATIVAALALPGYYLSLLFVHKIGCKRLQLFGFYAIAVVFVSLGLEQHFKVGWMWLELLLFGLTFLFSNFGPNTTTFILPTELYPSVVRATCHGLSAASGKLGGVVGTSLFSVVQEKYGLPTLLFACAIVAVGGSIITHLCIPADIKRHPRPGSVAISGYHPKHLYHPDNPSEHPHKYGKSGLPVDANFIKSGLPIDSNFVKSGLPADAAFIKGGSPGSHSTY